MKRKLAILLTTIMCVSLAACSKTEEANVSVESVTEETESVEEMIEETVEIQESVAESIEETVETEEIVVEEVEEVVEEVKTLYVPSVEIDVTVENTIDDDRAYEGMNKVIKLLEAYKTLLAQGKMLEDHIQYDIENLDACTADLTWFITGDGKPYQTVRAIWATGIVYYNNFVNNNTGYYDLEDWLYAQPDNQSVVLTVPEMETFTNTNDCLFLEAIGLVPYLNSCETVKAAELIETSDYTISGMSSSFAIKLDCDGDTGLTAVFDENCNLLNVCSAEDWDNYVYTFNDNSEMTNE